MYAIASVRGGEELFREEGEMADKNREKGEIGLKKQGEGGNNV